MGIRIERPTQERTRFRTLTSGWGWLGLLRLGLVLAMAAYTAAFQIQDRSVPRLVLPASWAVIGSLAILTAVQLAPRFRASARLARLAFVGDVIAVLGSNALFAFDSRRYLLALLVVVQAEGGAVFGLTGVIAWLATTGGYAAVEAVSSSVSHTGYHWEELALRSGVGLLVAIGGGALSHELSGERFHRHLEREVELARLQEAEARYRLLVEQIPVVTYIDAMDHERTTVYMSPQIEQMLGYTAEEWAADPRMWTKLLYPEDRDWVLTAHRTSNSTGEPFQEEYRMLTKDDRVVWVRDQAAVVRDEHRTPRFWQGVLVDITERKQAEEQVTYLAYHDKLTGLPNRAMFESVLDLALARAHRSQESVAVLYMDLDNFKLVNDSLGHAAGDELLREMATRLQIAVRATDVLARQGGDEFLVLLADLERSAGTGMAGAVGVARTIASRIHESLKQPFTLSGIEFFVTGSIGIALFPESATDARSLLKQADAAMYRSKQASPGNSVIYATEFSDALGRLSMATRLRRSVEAGDWTLHYQPIVELGTGRIVAVEALLRWRQASGRLLAPAQFIPLAEEMGLINRIGDWVIEELCRQSVEWREAGLRSDVSFNVSPRQLWQPDAVSRLMERVEASSIEPSTLIVEITESAAMRDPERTQRVLQDIHEAGLRLAIDDFGTGYSSLARLHELPVDLLKIDRKFVRDVPEDPDAASLVRAVVGLAESLSMQAVAEGIERAEQLAFLVGMGCGLGQGFHFSPPLPAVAIARLLRGERIDAAG